MKPRCPYWNWLAAAFALAGIILFVFATLGPPASSSGFVSALKGGLSPLAPEYTGQNPHYTAIPGPGSWLFAFVLGMAAGGFAGGRTWNRPVKDIPELWQNRFGTSPLKRNTAAFAGGFIILLASRLAGGCTLGLFISGSSQLALSGLYFGGLIFAFAMITARLVYGKQLTKGEDA